MKNLAAFLLLNLFFPFLGFSQMDVLLVNDNGSAPGRMGAIKTALTNGGYVFDTINTTINGGSPTFAQMSNYNVVIWYTGNDGTALSLWNRTDIENQHIKDYIDNGGMFWLQGLDWLYDKYGAAPDFFAAGTFAYDYLGIQEYHGQSHSNDGVFSDGVQQFDLVPGNGIFTLNPMRWSYATMWYADALAKTPNAGNLYMMGPVGYDFDDYAGSIYNEKINGANTGRVISIATETARFDTQAHLDQYINEGLTYFDQFIIVNIPVASIDVNGQGNATTITMDGGSLQFFATVLPANATNGNVAWSLVEETATASIDNNGLLTATGTPAGNGTLWVKASAVDGSGVADSVQITISNQGNSTNFHVLLVNDNNYDGARYLELDSALVNSGYVFDLYNTATTSTFPAIDILNDYEAVIWYTGNDGTDLKLWDLTDPNNYKFNSPLIEYIDNGGLVWVQGIDFLYDVYGSAPDVFTDGQFIYDYMGIEEYHAQSWADDGNTGVTQIDVVPANGIFTITPVTWVYTELRYADALIQTADAYPLYKMGPAGYALDDYACSLYKMQSNGMIMLSTIEPARINNQINTDTYIDEGLTMMEDYAAGTIPVNDIEVTGEGGETTIDIDGGALQMVAEVFPHFANDKTVTWSIVPVTATASINGSGLLSATGTPAGNGTVWAKATAGDGSGVADSLLITITNQGSGNNFNVLLVNDNDYGTDRFLEIDTALLNLNYNYDIYNTAVTGTIPDYTLLNNYQVVIWYTGNDGVDLNLWDITDPDDYKFNTPLIQYIDNGGFVWLQGLDFLYDVYGNAPDIFEEGSFLYDYIGIQEYHAQSWADDGNTGMVQMDTVFGNGIFNLSPVSWTYTELHYADAMAITPSAQAVYHMGPAGYQFNDYYCGIYNYQASGGMVMSFTVETARVDTQENTDTLIDQGLSFFEYALENNILVTDIDVYTEDGVNTINVDGGTLQCYADVFPVFAPNRDVEWSIVNGTATAFINIDGMVAATGNPTNGNGTVWAKATAVDGSGIADSLMITISNQSFPNVPVTDIIVTGEDGATTIEIDGGSLQMLAEVLPVNASQDSVLWSVVPGTTTATIDAFGVLSALGEDNSNGTVWAKATAWDGMGAVDSLLITISNQSSDIVLVEEIIVSGAGGATTINIDGGTLQMIADVFPENATDDSVLWSVVPGTTTATINPAGLLTASGENDGNGTVWAKATAVDGSGVADSIQITITNQQTNVFEILLVNDNANGTDRYLVIDTTLNNLGYNYSIFNAAVEGTFPTYATLENYDLVIWYTGNDGVDLKLWDITNTEDYKFNEPLIQYIDNGGKVWVQGLDFLYDVYGSAPVSFVQGQFTYDYLGIAEYHAQSHIDDGIYSDGVPQLDVEPGNGICTMTPIQWTYATMWYVDAIALTPGTNGLYTMGPDEYDFSDYYSAFYRVLNQGIVITCTFETARINNRTNTETFFWEVIENIDQMVDVKKLNTTNIQVYPNPASGLVNFVLPHSNSQNISLKLFNSNGQMVYVGSLQIDQLNQVTVDFSNLNSGVYFYEILGDDYHSVGRLVLVK